MCLKTMKKVDDKGKEKEHNSKLTSKLLVEDKTPSDVTRVGHAAAVLSARVLVSVKDKTQNYHILVFNTDVSTCCLVHIAKVILSKYQMRSSLST